MTMGRDSATATLLLDGRVLIAGGGGYVEARSAELYNPKSGTFRKTGSMAAGHEGGTATLLLDGRVLFVGGGGWTSPTKEVVSASAELYDPKTGTFTRTGSLPAARASHTATRLADGRVLIAGGHTPSEPMGDPSGTSTAEVFDPKTGTFSPTGSMTTGRILHTATLLHGRVLMAGGNGDTSAELYNPTTGTFSSTGSMEIKWQHTATMLNDGRVLVVGAEAADLYNPATGKFTPTGQPKGYCLCGWSPVDAPLLKDGRVLFPSLISDASGKDVDSAELYDPITGTFSQAGHMKRSRYYFTDTLLADGRVLFAGDSSAPACGMVCISPPPSEAAAYAAQDASAELYVP